MSHADGLDRSFVAALQARARNEADFVVCIAGIRQVEWNDALAAYEDCFRDAARALLDRVKAARERRNK